MTYNIFIKSPTNNYIPHIHNNGGQPPNFTFSQVNQRLEYSNKI